MLMQHIEVNKLIKARPLDNIEFMQWMKSYFDSHCNGQNLNYDAAARRANSKTGSVKGAAGKPRIPLSSAATTATVNSSTTPAKSQPASKKAPGTRQFGQAVTATQSAATDSALAAQMQEAADQVCICVASKQAVSPGCQLAYQCSERLTGLQSCFCAALPCVVAHHHLVHVQTHMQGKQAIFAHQYVSQGHLSIPSTDVSFAKLSFAKP